ncbi:hypothetical protein G5V59_12080 [Nocardioides sp. W3-2-3]|uniref:hypothetical protein n=1 Tax=Nocardioides convexus TaxID=2712224 RepID=UPI0024184DC6|nr:hypothetical protein [Nocardioides convexus]NHA00514.1 hypothetical protein [Nocardioides convexus]
MFRISTARARGSFGVFSNAMGRTAIRGFIGAPDPRNVDPDVWPIPDEFRTKLADLLIMLLETRKARDESSQIRVRSVAWLQSSPNLAAESVAVLKKTQDLDDALDAASDPTDQLRRAVRSARQQLEKAIALDIDEPGRNHPRAPAEDPAIGRYSGGRQAMTWIEPPGEFSPNQLADFIEAEATFSEDEYFSISELRGLFSSGRQPTDDQFSFALQEIERRTTVFGPMYPFLADQRGVYFERGSHSALYQFLAIMSLRGTPVRVDRTFPRSDVLFDAICREAFRAWGGMDARAVVFAHPARDGRPTKFDEAITWVANLMGVPATGADLSQTTTRMAASMWSCGARSPTESRASKSCSLRTPFS